MAEAQLVTGIASEPKPPTLSVECCARSVPASARYERERAAVQREIDRLQSSWRRERPRDQRAAGAERCTWAGMIQALVISEE